MVFKKRRGGGNNRFNKQRENNAHYSNANYEFEEDQMPLDDDSADDKKWYNMHPDEMDADCPDLPSDEIEKLRSEAQKMLQQETAIYNSKSSKGGGNSENEWIRTVMHKGTTSDRIAAHVVAIQDAPLYTLPLLKNLVGMTKLGKKNECVMVQDTLTELFLLDLLRPEKKLRSFEDCPLALLDKYSSGNHISRKSRLIHWYYEDQLKELYQTFVASLYTAGQDTVERTKERAISSMYKLLAGNPEQEVMLLKNLINKMGDPSQKVASKAIYCLTQMLRIHPNMKFVVMEETEKLLFRPNIGSKAQYYGVCFLSQFILRTDEKEVARNLIQIYFSFFKACIKKGDVDSRLMSVLLIGVNRAYPFAKESMDKMMEHIDTMYRVVYNSNFNVSLHSLSLIFQVSDFANSITDRFYSALYKKMLDPDLATSCHQASFISLVFKALKKDEDTNRIRVILKRLFQICCYLPIPVVCGILFMVSQVCSMKEKVLALKMEARTNVSQMDDDDEDEHYEDIKLEDSENEETNNPQEKTLKKNKIKEEEKESIKVSQPTWHHCKIQESANVGTKSYKSTYDPMQRNPSYAGGEHCVHVELLKLSQHCHPTVTLFANSILQGELITYTGDPLQDFTLPKFLERFAFKNPKQQIKTEVPNLSTFSRKKTYLPQGVKSIPVKSESYVNEDDSRIPVEELFIYRFLKKKREGKKKQRRDKDDDASSVASDEFDEMMDSLLGVKDETDLDYAEDVAKSKYKKREEEDESGGDDDGDEEDEDEEYEEEVENDDGDIDDDDMKGELDDISDIDEDAEDIVFDSDMDGMEDDDDDGAMELMPNGKRKKDSKGKKKHDKDNPFLTAEEFSEMLDNIGASGLKAGGSSAMSNKDKAAQKQLKWEAARDYWVRRKEKKPKKNQTNKRKWTGRPGSRNNGKNTKRRKKS